MQNGSGKPSGPIDTRIPVTVCLGVTGHRTLADERLIAERVKKALSTIDILLQHTPHAFTVVSPLAEGSDRIVAREILAWAGSGNSGKPTLEAVLPLPAEEYSRDFASPSSAAEFDSLLARASSVRTLDPSPSRTAAYAEAGRYVVDHCDILIAVWDGKPAAGQSGTAEVVQYAHAVGRSMIWIYPGGGKIVEHKGRDCAFESLEDLDTYNGKEVAAVESASAVERQMQIIHRQAGIAGLEADLLHPLLDSLLPHFVRADLLVQKYQRYYKTAGIAVYTLAAAAVATVALQPLYFPHIPQLLWLEVAAMGVILLLLGITHARGWHRRWIDCRFLAERLRGMIFLDLAGAEFESPDAPVHLRLSRHPDDWIVRAVDSIRTMRMEAEKKTGLRFEPLRDFLLAAWVVDQRDFYARTGLRYDRRQRGLALAGEILFFLTLVIAAVHAAGAAESCLPDCGWTAALFPSLAIIFPSLGTALGGIRLYREYRRNAERYSRMAEYLTVLGGQMKNSGGIGELIPLLKQANEVMMLENADWRVLILTQELRPA